MFNPQMTSSQMELLPLVCLCLLSWSGTTSADPPVVVTEDDDVILPCSINGVNMETGVFEWKKDGQTEVFLYSAGSHYNNGRTGQDQQFKGRISHFEEELKHGNASIKIRNTKMADSGDYTCKFPNNHPGQPAHVKLVVAALKPCVTTLRQTENSALLLCEAHGVPDIQVHWQDSDGNILPAEESHVIERGGRKYIIVMTTVTKNGRFHCVASLINFGHRISSQIFVHLPGIVVVKEGGDVILPCSPNFNAESQTFHWNKDGQKVFTYVAGRQSDGQAEQFKGRVSHFQDQLKQGNAAIKITNTKVDDSGDYTCEFPNIQPCPTFKIELVVVVEAKPQTDYTGWIFAGRVSCLLVAVVVGVLVVVLYKQKLKRKRDEKQPEEIQMNQQNSENQSDPDV